MTIQKFKQHWRELLGSEPLAYSHRFLASRLGYQIQELAYDGLDDVQIDVHRKRTHHDRSIADMRLIREWQGVKHTVIQEGYEWECRSYKSLPAVVWAIAGTRWNGWTFFGLQSQKGSG